MLWRSPLPVSYTHLLDNAKTVIVEVNENLPWVYGLNGCEINIADVDMVVEGGNPPVAQLGAGGAPTEVDTAVANLVVPQIPNGACLHPIGELFPFKNHPFKVLDDESMQRTVESVEQYGVLSPLIARPRPEGGYEIISGHRRQHAAQLAGLDALPVIVRQMDDDAAVLLMVDSNLQRENILPSERAFAYKMKLEALKNQGARSDLTSCQVGTKFRADELLAENSSESARNVQRFIRLTNLVPELLDMVDEKKIAFNPAVELSYLDESQQRDFLEAMNDTQNAPSLSQAQRLKKLAQEGHFSYDVAFAVMGEEKKDELDKVVIKNDTLRKYFPRSYTPKQMMDTIIKLLEQWQRKQQRQNER